jgi:hypothetical protein
MKLFRVHQELIHEEVRGYLALRGSFGRLAEARRSALASDMTVVTASLIDRLDPASAAGLAAEIDFPSFVSDLIAGTFDAVVDASIQQMEAYADLVREVAGELGGAEAGAAGAARFAERLRPRLRAVAARPGHVAIRLPKLPGADALEPESIRSVAVVYVVYELEALGLLAVADQLVALFMQGQLPITGGDATALLDFARAAPSRPTEDERRAVYERVLGPGGGASGDFDECWRRFLSDVTAALAGAPVDPPPRLLDPVRASGLALARLASERGSGATRAAARSLGELAKACLDLVALASIVAALGARDRWQLIERVGALHLGTSPEVARHRERASAGGAILEWIADHASALATAPVALAGLARPVARWLATEPGDRARIG